MRQVYNPACIHLHQMLPYEAAHKSEVTTSVHCVAVLRGGDSLHVAGPGIQVAAGDGQS